MVAGQSAGLGLGPRSPYRGGPGFASGLRQQQTRASKKISDKNNKASIKLALKHTVIVVTYFVIVVLVSCWALVVIVAARGPLFFLLRLVNIKQEPCHLFWSQ